MGDGAQVFNHLFSGHADAGVADGQQALFGVGGDVDHELSVRVQYLTVGEHLEVDARQGVRCVGDQFAQEDFPVGVEGMDQDVEQLASFGLESGGGGGWGCFFHSYVLRG